ncbi:MAG TPA: DUF4337 domain-containing protein [Verrucomicrobiae bacterium]|nr:DUF4337 domain-containing protein [Verrucomicrobiae bacterium]
MQSSDLAELKQLVGELRAEHVAQKEKEKRESWVKYVSLTMVIVAVLAAVASLKGGGFSTRTLKEMNEATFNQTQASDQWAYYQAKAIKMAICEMEVDRLTSQASQDPTTTSKLKGKIEKYQKEMAEISGLAKNYEAERDKARGLAAHAAEHSKRMGLAITLYQIAIATGAMCLIVKKKPLWAVSSVFAVLATAQMVFVLFILPV